MAKVRMEIRVGRAGNGTPVFMAAGNHPTFSRPFGATWDEGRAMWMYPAFFPASDKVLSDFDVVSGEVDIVLSEPVQRHIASLGQVRERLTQRWLPPAFEFITKPYEHQIDGLCHVYYNMRAALFYEQGLGKCKIAIDLVRLLRATGVRAAALVLGPRVTVQNWGREIDFHSGRTLSWITLTGTPKQKRKAIEKAAAEGIDIVLSTYDTARSLVDSLVSQLPYGVLVCDESHNVKSWRSDRTKSTWEIAQKASRRVLMTGSPTEGNPLDLYGPYKILGDCFMPENYFAYKKKFVETLGPNSPIVKGYKHLDVLNARTTFLGSRRTKAQCLDLPPRTFVDVDYELSDTQGIAYNQIVTTLGVDPAMIAELVAILRSGDPVRALQVPALPPAMELPHRAAALIKLQQITSGFLVKNEKDLSFCDNAGPGGGPCPHMTVCVDNGIKPHTPRCEVDKTPWPRSVTYFEENPKLDAIMETLESVLDEPSHKVIVWCEHIDEMNLLCERLLTAGMSHVRMDGSVADPQAVIDAFNLDPAVRVYVGQSATGVGITLNAAAYVIYSSLPFPLVRWTQTLDRNYRIGQKNNVTVYRLIGRGTLEAAVAHLLDHKINVDALLTSKIECGLCPRAVQCRDAGVEPFEEGCIHPRRVARPTVKARVLPMFPGGNT
jgi:SNF2 family DNA or RNA helicase